MPIARTRKGRVEQVLRWLVEQHPPPRPVELRWHTRAEDPDQGSSWREGRRCVVSLLETVTWVNVIHVLLHEYAHILTWSQGKRELEQDRRPHDAEWGVAYARVYEHFYDLDGYQESRSY